MTFEMNKLEEKWGQSGDKLTCTWTENKKGCNLNSRNLLISLVPEVGIEPTLPRGKGDFESPASTSFTTPARRRLLRGGHPKVKKNVLTRLEILC